jgi:hypothetical protein
MSIINRLNGPRVPTSTASAAREAPRTSFLSRVQAGASGATSLPASAPAVSGRDIVSKAISSAKAETAASGTTSSGTEGLTPEQQQQMEAVKEMSKSFLMGTMQSIFQGFGEGPKVEQE